MSETGGFAVKIALACGRYRTSHLRPPARATYTGDPLTGISRERLR